MFNNIGKRGEVFTHILYDYETSPLDLFVRDGDEEPMRIRGEKYFKDYVEKMSDYYDSKHLLMTVGSGLNFEKAELYLQQIKMLITHFNLAYSKIKIMFSTLSFYNVAMAAHRGKSLPVSYEDQISYSHDGRFYVSGLYTSRPNLKSYIRRAS